MVTIEITKKRMFLFLIIGFGIVLGGIALAGNVVVQNGVLNVTNNVSVNDRLFVKYTDTKTSSTGTVLSGIVIQNTLGNTYYSGIDFKGSQATRIASILVDDESSGSSLKFGTSNNYGNGVTHEYFRIGYDGKTTTTGIFQDTSVTATGSANICYDGTGQFGSCTSDARLKKNIRDINGNPTALELNMSKANNSIDGIMNLKIRIFDWYDDSVINQTGFIAQEIEKVFPQVIRVGKEDGYLEFDAKDLVPFIIDAMQTQQKTIEKQGKLIDELVSIVCEENPEKEICGNFRGLN